MVIPDPMELERNRQSITFDCWASYKWKNECNYNIHTMCGREKMRAEFSCLPCMILFDFVPVSFKQGFTINSGYKERCNATLLTCSNNRKSCFGATAVKWLLNNSPFAGRIISSGFVM